MKAVNHWDYYLVIGCESYFHEDFSNWLITSVQYSSWWHCKLFQTIRCKDCLIDSSICFSMYHLPFESTYPSGFASRKIRDLQIPVEQGLQGNKTAQSFIASSNLHWIEWALSWPSLVVLFRIIIRLNQSIHVRWLVVLMRLRKSIRKPTSRKLASA